MVKNRDPNAARIRIVLAYPEYTPVDMAVLSHDYLFIRQPAWMNVSISLRFVEQKYHFYLWNPATSEVRWMTSFDTTKKDVQNFVAALKDALKASAAS